MRVGRSLCKTWTWCRRIVTHHKPSYAETQTNKTFFLTVLAATATKRDAKAYIEKYQKPYHKARVVHVKESRSVQDFFNAADGALLDVVPSLAHAEPIRVALITIRDASHTRPGELERIAETLSQLHRLGLQPVVIIDAAAEGGPVPVLGHARHVERFAQMLEHAQVEARPITEGLFNIRSDDDTRAVGKPLQRKRRVTVYDTRVLKAPVCRRQIPVLQCTATTQRGQKTSITADSAMAALCQAFGAVPDTVPFQADIGRAAFCIDKVIVIDRVGGIYSPQRKRGSHVFINLDQESLSLERELATLATPATAEAHLRNLDTCRVCLELLADSASAIVTTPETAGSVVTGQQQQHPLIHNLLTDRPLFSPSLPVHGTRTPTTLTTILRKGVPVTTHRDMRRVNLAKLKTLIDDSFGRQLDMPAYLARLEQCHVAAIVVAGDYDGAAIITAETPDDGSGEPVPYLDKFAVLRAKQGAGGVADILFNAMISAFPEELIWRSRNTNPVNKWYFERAAGTFVIPPTAAADKDGSSTTQWRLFWRTRPQSQKRFEEFIQVARKIQPTWLD